jgi:hypothetical protein
MTDSPTHVEPQPKWRWPIVIALLVIHAGLAIDTARRLSITHDEYWHVPVGMLMLTGDFEHDRINPPLLRQYLAIPVVLSGYKMQAPKMVIDATAYGAQFVELNPNDFEHAYFLARCMNIVLSLGTALLLAQWAFKLAGPIVSIAAVALWCLCPLTLGLASLATTDIGCGFLFTACGFCFWEYSQRPSRRMIWITGIVLGLAQLAKFTSLFLYLAIVPVWLVLAVTKRQQTSNGDPNTELRTNRPAIVFGHLGIVGISLVVLNVGYLFHGTGSSLATISPRQNVAPAFVSNRFQGLSKTPVVGSFPLPVPRDYVLGLDQLSHVSEAKHPVYLNGRWRFNGFWYYYAFALVYKLPIGFLLLFAASLWAVFKHQAISKRNFVFVIIAPLVIFTVASTMSLQLGLRYLLPVLPFGVLIASLALTMWKEPSRSMQLVFAISVISIAIAGRHHPNHLSYFNVLVGGPESGRHLLIDSNIDWGQNVRDLKQFVEENNIRELRLAYFGSISPTSYDLQYETPTSFYPTPGWNAISVNFVMGRPHSMRLQDGEVRAVNIDEFGYFRFFEPTAKLGESIDVYHLSAGDVARWRAAFERAHRQ